MTIDDGSGCTGLASIFVEQDPDETPTVSLDNDAAFCEGGSVTLTSSPAPTTWSTGETTQSITVDQSGTFSVSVTGVCGASTSDDVVIDVYPTVMPVASNVVCRHPAAPRSPPRATASCGTMWPWAALRSATEAPGIRRS